MTEEQLEIIQDQLAAANCSYEMSDVLSPLSNDQLQDVHEDLLDQYGQELALGALERSEWLCGNLIINANHPSICFTRTALDAVGAEIEERKAMAAHIATGIPN